MSVYREPGDVSEPRQKPSIGKVIEEAWKVCDERKRERVGPKPPRWRMLKYATWKLRMMECQFMTPDPFDLLEARRRLDARESMDVELMVAWSDAHRGARWR